MIEECLLIPNAHVPEDTSKKRRRMDRMIPGRREGLAQHSVASLEWLPLRQHLLVSAGTSDGSVRVGND